MRETAEGEAPHPALSVRSGPFVAPAATAVQPFDFYTETKTIYVDFSGGLQRAQIDNYQDALESPDLQGY